MRNLLTYLKPYKKQCVIGPACKFMEAILELLLPAVMAYIIDKGITNNDIQLVFTLGALMILMVIIGFGFSITCQYNAALASQGFGTNLRNAVFRHISHFSYEDIDYFTTSSLTNRLTNDINQLQLAVAMMIRLVIRSPFIVIGSLVITMFLDLQLSLILIASIPITVLVLYLFIRFSTPLYKHYQKKLDRFASILDDNLAGVRVIRAFVSQRRETKRFDETAEDLQKQMMKVSRLSALLNPMTSLIVNGAIVILLWRGSIQIHIGRIQPGIIIAFINYATSILIALVAISNLIVIFTKAAASAQRVNEVLAHTPSLKEGDHTFSSDNDVAISFDNVSFCYGEGEPAIRNITFTIHKNETIGIIGGTGSGKSTLINLMCRFYDASSGIVNIFAHNVQDYNTNNLHQKITLVPQANELFSSTIRDNLVFGLNNIQDGDIWLALDDAQASDFVKELPKGLDTFIERGGTNISGGQRQRLCIARALLRKTNILVLDDAFSALDFKTDAMLRNALKLRGDNKTFIIVSQRVGTLLACDRILVIEDGSLAGFDSHEQLYEQCSVYHEICETQNIGRDAK